MRGASRKGMPGRRGGCCFKIDFGAYFGTENPQTFPCSGDNLLW